MITNLSGNKYHAGIRGTGYYVPERVVTNKEIEQHVYAADEWIQEKIGIKERRIASEHETTSELAYRAAVMAIDDAGIKSSDIDLIILISICPDHREPATAYLIQEKIGAVNSAAFDLNASGCPGPAYAISVASSFVAIGACKNVLVIGADIVATTLVDWNDKSTCYFFGDGAGAVVISRTSEQGIKGCSMHSDSSGYDRVLVPAIGTRNFPDGKRINRLVDGTSPYLQMDGKAMYGFATSVFPASVREIVKEVGTELSDIDVVIPHQSNINIIKESMRKLSIPFEKAYVNIHKYGNTMGASVFIALAEAVREGRIREGSKVAIASFGAGFAWGAVLLEWNRKEDFIN